MTVLPARDSESDLGEDAKSEDEETAKRWLSTTYERGSKKPMKEPLTASWDLPISDTDMKKIKVGFKSFSMEDEWDLLVEDPDKNGNISLHIIQNWLQEDYYILYIILQSGNDNNASARIQGITWEGNKAGLQCSKEQAKIKAMILSRGWLHCDFEKLPHYPTSMLWARSGYKRLETKKSFPLSCPPPPNHRIDRYRKPGAAGCFSSSVQPCPRVPYSSDLLQTLPGTKVDKIRKFDFEIGLSEWTIAGQCGQGRGRCGFGLGLGDPMSSTRKTTVVVSVLIVMIYSRMVNKKIACCSYCQCGPFEFGAFGS